MFASSSLAVSGSCLMPSRKFTAGFKSAYIRKRCWWKWIKTATSRPVKWKWKRNIATKISTSSSPYIQSSPLFTLLPSHYLVSNIQNDPVHVSVRTLGLWPSTSSPLAPQTLEEFYSRLFLRCARLIFFWIKTSAEQRNVTVKKKKKEEEKKQNGVSIEMIHARWSGSAL